jgi:anti-sigma regulatory factor (Ser/Thr protein kinase)
MNGQPPQQVVTRFAPTTAAVPAMRAKTVQMLTAWSVDAEAVAVVELVTSELITNAVRASRPDDEFIAVRLSIAGSHVAVEVWSRPDATEVCAQHPSEDSENGRGLALVEALSSRWDAYQAESGGVVVWAQVPARVLPAQRTTGPGVTPMPRREPHAVTYSPPAPVAPRSMVIPGFPHVAEWSTDPEVLARVAERLRAKFPWHERPTDRTDDDALTFAGSATGPATHQDLP